MGDGDWMGFRFPSQFHSSSPVTIQSNINLSYASFGDVSVRDMTLLGKVTADQITISGALHFVPKLTWLRAREAQFHGKVFIGGSCSGAADFGESEFHSSAQIYGQWGEEFRLNSAIFHDFVEFRGGWIIYASTAPGPAQPPTRKPMFSGLAILQDIKFSHPARVRFHSVSLEKALLLGTDLIGAHFYDVIWPDVAKGRLGLYDELHTLTSTDPTYPARALPKLETAYRNCRLALEKSHEYATATDFYVGEMRIRRLLRHQGVRPRNWIEDIYRLLSNYGASPGRALGCLGALAITHFLVNQILICVSPDLACTWKPAMNQFLSQAANSIRVVTLQRFLGGESSNTPGQALLDSVVAGLAPIQIALVVLAIRSKIRR